jgi:CheY-like chemotaxis protein
MSAVPKSRAFPLRVLVVEDDASMRFLIREVFAEDFGYEVVEAASADEAIDLLRNDQAFECVFTDVRMPGRFDGIDLARHVMTEHPGLKIVMASGNLRDNERLHEVPYFPKPYSFEKVARFISDYVATS